MRKRILRMLSLSVLVLMPQAASADLLTIWAAGKGAYVQGTGNMFETIEPTFRSGVEGGIELLDIDFMAEAYVLAKDQFLFTTNIGMDVTYTYGLRFTLGGYLTGYVFKSPEPGGEMIILNDDLRADLDNFSSGLSNQVEGAFMSQYDTQAQELSQWAFGIGPRARLQMDHAVNRLVRIGAEASFGYHHMLSGNDLIAEAKMNTMNTIIAENGIPKALGDRLKEEVGAESISEDKLSGTNYSVGIFLMFEL